MSHTEVQDVTYYNGHVIEVNGKRYVPERTCDLIPIPYRQVPIGYEYKCSVCGYPMTDHDSYCSECGARRV